MSYYDKDDDTDTWDRDSYRYPETDPYLPKPTCPLCLGEGFLLNREGGHYTCPNCFGSGCDGGH